MIGQRELLNKINTLIDSYPKFSIIVGPQGSGKKTIVKHICKKLYLPIVNFGVGIDEVRQIIDLSYEQTEPICYVCADADGMSLGAKNCLLKITEEPPNNAYFMLTLLSMSNTLETIQSRGTVLYLDSYTEQELIDYRTYKNYSPEYDNIIRFACCNVGDVDELFKFDVKAFYTFAQTVAFQVHIPVSGNIFKIPKQLKTSANGDGYNPVLFFKTIRNLYLSKAKETKDIRYLKAAEVTSVCLRDLNLTTVAKLGIIDKWIMDVRAVLRA